MVSDANKTQDYLTQHKNMEYSAAISGIILWSGGFLFFTYIILITLLRFKMYGFTFWLQLFLFIGTIFVLAVDIIQYKTTHALIVANEQSLQSAYENYRKKEE